MANIRSLLTGPHADIGATRMAIAKHVEEIVLLPEGQGQAIKYKGSWKLLGNVEYAEGGNYTTRVAPFRLISK
jgi:hypothetical protein